MAGHVPTQDDHTRLAVARRLASGDDTSAPLRPFYLTPTGFRRGKPEVFEWTGGPPAPRQPARYWNGRIGRWVTVP